MTPRCSSARVLVRHCPCPPEHASFVQKAVPVWTFMTITENTSPKSRGNVPT